METGKIGEEKGVKEEKVSEKKWRKELKDISNEVSMKGKKE